MYICEKNKRIKDLYIAEYTVAGNSDLLASIQIYFKYFYSSIITSDLTFVLICWRANRQKQNKDRLDKKKNEKRGGIIGSRKKNKKKQVNLDTFF